MITTNFETFARRFLESTDVSTKLALATEIRDCIEIIPAADYRSFLQYLFPVFYNMLRQGTPQFNAESLEQKLRNVLLEILNRLQNNELLRTYVPNLLKLSMFLLEVENEDNALICLRIIIDLHKNYRPTLETEVQPFLDIVQKIYSELGKTVANTFKEGKPPAPQPNAQNPDAARTGTLVKSMASFKVLTECPIIVVLLFQLYSRLQTVNIPKFMPLIISTLTLQAPPVAKTTHRSAYVDFIAAQVKTLSFLAYMLRGFAEHLRPYQESIPKCIIQLLLNCPNESAGIRKELLIATRHILATDFRTGFVPHIDTLLDEKILIGSGRTSYENLRPLAYSTLADLIHHVRSELTLPRLFRVVHLYSRNIHDPTLPFTIQTMSAKLLLNLVECIARKSEEGKGRGLLVRILDAFVNKFSSLRKQIPKLIDKQNANVQKNADNIKDCRLLMKTLVLGLKNIVWGINSCIVPQRPVASAPGQPPIPQQPVKQPMSVEECLMFTSLLKNGLKCFSIYSAGPSPSTQEEKDILDHFAAVFTMVDAKIFQDVFCLKMQFLFDQMLDNQLMLTIPQHFLANSSVSRIFADVLLNFLIDRMKDLSGGSKPTSSVLLRLFKLVFGSVTLFAENEPVLQPHLSTIINQTLKYTSEVADPSNYFVLLRALFRSIGGGKFDLFFKEFIPSLPGLLETLNKLHVSAHSSSLRDLFVELALTIPVRLSALLSCLRALTKPLVLALESTSMELVVQGLRTLELWVDNLAPEFLDPILEEIKTGLMSALWKHVKPSPYPHGPQVMRILGKLAGRNRNFMQYPAQLTWREEEATAITYSLPVDNMNNIDISLDSIITSVRHNLMQSGELEAKKQAFVFVKTCLNSLFNAKTARDADINMDDGKSDQRIQYERSIAKLLFETLIIAHADEKLTESVEPYLESINTHYAISLVPGLSLVDVTELGPTVYFEALFECLTSENRNYQAIVLKCLDSMVKTLTSLTPDVSKEAYALNETFEKWWADELYQGCFNAEWHCKAGCRSGLAHLIDILPIKWARNHECRFIKALLVILKDLQPEISLTTLEEAAKTLEDLIRKCHGNFKENRTTESSQAINEVLSMMTPELSSQNALVRTNIRTNLAVLAELTGIELPKLLEDYKSILLTPLSAKPLRSLKFMVQTGYLDALTFCLNLNPTFISFTPDLLKLLQGAVEIADKEDFTNNKSMPPKGIMLVNQLRMVSIDLLSAAMGNPEFASNPEYADMRKRIIGIFFKALTQRSKEIIAVAKRGLSQVIQQQKLPKDLLQSSLRPVLLNLADHKKLSVPLLQGLSRLLDLLTNCFNVTLGEKLLEHLNKWTEPGKMAAAYKQWKDGEEINIASAIIDIFHLLPSAASKFLEPLVNLTIQLEAQLPKELTSPYRTPLIKFLNRYATDAVDFFLPKLNMAAHSKLFRFVIKDKEADDLRAELANSPAKIISHTFKNTTTQPQLEVQFQGLLIVRTLVKYKPEWLSQTRDIVNCLVEIWQSNGRLLRLQNDENVPLQYFKESKLLIKCFLNYSMHNKADVDPLFYMLSVFTVRTTIDNTFLRDFYQYTVPKLYSSAEKTVILNRFLDFYRDPNLAQENKVQMIQVLVAPLISSSFETTPDKKDKEDKEDSLEVAPMAMDDNNNVPASDGIETIDRSVIASIIGEILALEVKPEPFDEALNIELLQLATLLVKQMPNELVEHRKELIKFAWNHLKSEDTTTKQSAYVLICRFIEAYDTPPKIILQVYVALLRAHQAEARTLVKQGLDILLPALKQRLNGSPAWMRYTRKIIVEEGHSLPQLIHILQLIVRHPDLFYPFRGQFVLHMVNSLARVGLVPNSPTENRKLAVELASLIINWELQRLEEVEKKASQPVEAGPLAELLPEPMEVEGEAGATDAQGDGANPPAQPGEQQEFKVTMSIVEMIVNFLIRIASAANNGDQSATDLSNKSLELLTTSLTLWPDVSIKFAFFEKLLAPVGDQPAVVATGLAILNIILDHQLKKFVLDNLNQLKISIGPTIVGNPQLPKITTNLCTFLTKIMQTFPLADPSTEVAPFYGHIGDLFEQNLNNFDKSNVNNVLTVLKTMCEEKPDYLDRYIPPLVKMIQKLTKDHLSPGREVTTDPASDQHMSRASMSNVSKKIVKDTAATLLLAIALVNTRISQLGDNKKAFFGSLMLIIEKSVEVDLLVDITKTIGMWISSNSMDDGSTVMKIKDKIAFLSKMIRFEQLNVTPPLNLQTPFLELVYHVCSDDNITRSEMLQLESGFMVGLRCRDSAIRNRFFTLFQKDVPRTMRSRLDFLFNQQNWESIGNHFWLKQALEVLLALIPSKPLNLKTSTEYSSYLKLEYTEFQQAILSKHQPFLDTIQNVKTWDLLTPLMEMCQTEVDLAYDMWVLTFPKIWENLDDVDRDHISSALNSFLTKDYHLRQQKSQPNVIQSILEGVSKCSQTPKLQVEVVKYLGKFFNAWHTSIQLLIDKRLPNFDEISNDMALSDIFQSLSLDDLSYGILKEMVQLQETNSALTLEQHGFWQRAQDLWFSIMSKAQSGSMAVPMPKIHLSATESQMWEKHWISCAKRLGQWELLTEFSRSYGHPDLLLEVAWKAGDWAATRDALSKTNLPQESPHQFIYQGYLSIIEGKHQDMETIYNQGTQFALKMFQNLPTLPTVSHLSTLQTFQQLIELKESSHILKEITGPSKAQALPEMKSLLSTWRERTPNTWDSTLVWSDLLLWRQQVYKLLGENLGNINEVLGAVGTAPTMGGQNQLTGQNIGNHETAWTINQLARVARKHGLEEMSLHTLSKISQLPNIESGDAYLKLKEQVKAYRQMENSAKTAINFLNSTNLEPFSAAQKADLFRLKGEFLEKLGKFEEANTCFGTSLTHCDSLHQGWSSWAQFCDRQLQLGNSGAPWEEHTLMCYIQALKSTSKKSRETIPRILWLLSFHEDPNMEKLRNNLEKHLETIPFWIWIPWIPQLLQTLDRSDGQFMKMVLIKIAGIYPQSIFYHLRSFILEKKSLMPVPNVPILPEQSDVSGMEISGNSDEAPSTPPATPAESAPTSNPAPIPVPVAPTKKAFLEERKGFSPIQFCLKQADELLGCIKATSQALVIEMESLLKEITVTCAPHPYQSLTIILGQLLSVAYGTAGDEVTPNLKELMTDISVYGFVNSSNSQHNSILQEMKPKFDEAILAETQLEKLIFKLNEWQQGLEKNLNEISLKIPLQNVSLTLMDLQNSSIEIPGQYLQRESEPAPDFHVKLERFSSEINTVNHQRVIHMRATNGKLFSFCVDFRPVPKLANFREEEATSQLLHWMNGILGKHKEIQKRNLKLEATMLIPFAPMAALRKVGDECLSLDAIYRHQAPTLHEQLMLRYRASADKKSVSTEAMSQVSKSILTRHIKSHVTNPVHLFEFSMKFTADLALYSIVGHLLGIPDRNLSNISITKNTGEIVHRKYFPRISDENSPEIPFRYTRNLEDTVRSFRQEGVLSASCLSVVLALSKQKETLQNFLNVYWRDLYFAAGNHLPEYDQEEKWKSEIQEFSLAKSKQVANKLAALTPDMSSNNNNFGVPLDRKIQELLESAKETCLHSPASFVPWF